MCACADDFAVCGFTRSVTKKCKYSVLELHQIIQEMLHYKQLIETDATAPNYIKWMALSRVFREKVEIYLENDFKTAK